MADRYLILAPDTRVGDTPAVVYALHGLGGECGDWLEHTRLLGFPERSRIAMVFPDAGASWYCDAFDGSNDWERRFVEQTMPAAERDLGLRQGVRRAVVGLSMGGYGALKLALRFPDLFVAAGAHSASLLRVREPDCDGSPHPVFGSAHADGAFRRANDPFELAADRLRDGRLPALLFDCGLQDSLLEGNRMLHARLASLGVPHRYEEPPGHHTWPYWNRRVRYSLRFILEAMGIGG